MQAVAQVLEKVLTPDLALALDSQEPPPKPGVRSDDDYTIAALAKGLAVLEALTGQAYEPVTIREIQHRTSFDYDFCRRALKTLKAKGWAIEDDRGWRLSVKAMQFSDSYWKWAATLQPPATILKSDD